MTIDAIIRRITSLQDNTGLFPSVRSNRAIGYRRNDTNVFFTAVTVFTLQSLRQFVSADSQSLIDHVHKRAMAAYPLFRNKDGVETYNFWPTRPSQHFPNGYLFGRFDHFRIPDDIDDTAMVYLTTPRTPDDVLWLQNKLTRHANLSQPDQRQIRNTFAEYRNLRAYSTWFGKNMPIDFDACALANMLYCLYQYGLKPDAHMTDSLVYLRSIVESGTYVTEPFSCAPHYARTSLIMYHLTRLLAAFAPAELASVHPRLIADAYELFNQTTNRLEQSIVATSLLRLGQTPPPIDLTNIERDFSGFHSFIAGLLTAYEQPWLRRWADRPITQMRWQCDAHSWALVAEYAVLNEYLSSSENRL